MIVHGPEHADRLVLFALRNLPASEAAEIEAHLATCAECRADVEARRPVVDAFVAWPRAVVRPTARLWDRLERRLENGAAAPSRFEDDWKEPEWKEAGPGIFYQLLSKDDASDRVTMLVRLDPGARYPPHDHAGLEELHLLEGELWIDDDKLSPGEYNRAAKGTGDERVWSETGCTCVLVTSHRDVLK